jgi:hypothetical protein
MVQSLAVKNQRYILLPETRWDVKQNQRWFAEFAGHAGCGTGCVRIMHWQKKQAIDSDRSRLCYT